MGRRKRKEERERCAESNKQPVEETGRHRRLRLHQVLKRKFKGFYFCFLEKEEKRAAVAEINFLLHLNFPRFSSLIICTPFPRHFHTKTSSFLSLHSKNNS